jgi:hypothetical protein
MTGDDDGTFDDERFHVHLLLRGNALKAMTKLFGSHRLRTRR